MPRSIPLLAVLCTGLALGALTTAIVLSGRAPQPTLEEAPQFDPAAAAPEIAELRQSRGSILAGTSLALAEDPAEFSQALASQTGVEPVADTSESLVDSLRRTAREYEEHAERFESQQQYAPADELRRLADDTRRIARSLVEGPQAQASLVEDDTRR